MTQESNCFADFTPDIGLAWAYNTPHRFVPAFTPKEPAYAPAFYFTRNLGSRRGGAADARRLLCISRSLQSDATYYTSKAEHTANFTHLLHIRPVADHV